MGTSLAEVRLHTGSEAAAATAARGAHAFTVGNDIFFGVGRFAPHSTDGATRLAHELVHVEQQRRGRNGAAHADRRSAEREARRLGPAIASGQRVTVQAAAPRVMQQDGPDSEAEAGAGRAPAAGPQLQLDPEVVRLMLQHYIRWWLGSALLGEAPTSLSAPRNVGEVGPNAAAAGAAAAVPGVGTTISEVPVGPTILLLPAGPLISEDMLQLPLMPGMFESREAVATKMGVGELDLPPGMFEPLPPDPLTLEPDAGALFSPFGARGAPVGPGDSAAVMAIYRRNAAIASALPDLRGMAPRFIRGLIPSTWRRDVAGALTSAAVGASLKRDFATPVEISDRAFQDMTGASTTVIPLPSISFDLF